jgi:hypothetical protein
MKIKNSAAGKAKLGISERSMRDKPCLLPETAAGTPGRLELDMGVVSSGVPGDGRITGGDRKDQTR